MPLKNVAIVLCLSFFLYYNHDICVPGVIASGRVVGTLLGRVVHLSLCPLSWKVAACSGSRVVLLNAKVWNKVHTVFVQWIENKSSYAEMVQEGDKMPFWPISRWNAEQILHAEHSVTQAVIDQPIKMRDNIKILTWNQQ